MPSKNSKTILVTGATGKQGGAVLRHARQANFTVRAFTRDPNAPNARGLVGRGTEVVGGNLNDPSSISRALDGAWGVFSVQALSDDGVEGEVRQGINVADAAKRSRISHLVYSSVASADRHTGIPHFESKFRIEEHIRGTGLSWTIIRPVFFMENWLGMRDSIEAGEIALPLEPSVRMNLVAVDDIGGFATLAFLHPGKWQGKVMEIAGDELTLEELAARFGAMIGREVRYRQVPWDEFEQKAGREMTLMYRWFQDHGYQVSIPDARREYPALTSFEKWLRANWKPSHRTA
jgi:uncharacterized protein YbjT (DUF2867 family)